MKKLALFFAAVVLTAIGSNVFGQGTGAAPAIGSTHNYRVNGGVVSGTNTYAWSVDKGAIGTPAGADVTLVPVPLSTEVAITWNASAEPGANYYVRILESDGTCTNEKVLLVVPINPFFLSITTSGTPVCYPNDVAVTLLSDEPQYDHGTVDLVYTVTPNELGSAVGYGFNFTNILSNLTNFSVTDTTLSADATILGIDSDSIYVSTATPVVITFQITNDVLFDNTSDADGTGAAISMPTTISDGKTNQDVPDNGADGTYVATGNATRPATTEITFD